MKVYKSDVPIILFLWDCPDSDRTPIVIAEKTNYSYNYVCGKIMTLIQRGFIKKETKGKKSFYTKPLKGCVYAALHIQTGLSIRECADLIDKVK